MTAVAAEDDEAPPRRQLLSNPFHLRAGRAASKAPSSEASPPVNGRPVALDPADRALMAIAKAFGAPDRVAQILARPVREIDAVLRPLGARGLFARDGGRLILTAGGALALRQPMRSGPRPRPVMRMTVGKHAAIRKLARLAQA